MKKSILVLAVLFLVPSCCFAEPKFDISIPLPGETIAEPLLQRDLLIPVVATAAQYNKKCQSYSVSNTKLVALKVDEKHVKKGRYLNGAWVEVWTVDRCNTQVLVPIKFTLDGKGGTYYAISMPDVKTVKKTNVK